jgi:adenylate cyclase
MLVFAYGQDPVVAALVLDAWSLWILGYPDQALRRSHEACTRAEDLAHPHTLAYAFASLAMFHQYRRDRGEARRHAEAATRLPRAEPTVGSDRKRECLSRFMNCWRGW